MDASARMAFNMKVLRRHDPTIEDIIESASFVVLYSHDGEWTKTGIEGPMFLYRRSASPPYGFFVLNRNGVENFSANLDMADDLELTTEFIIYRASEGEDVTGIWIFEPSQRESVGRQMLKLQSTPITNSAPPPVSVASAPLQSLPPPAASVAPAGQSISLDALFGTIPAAAPSSSSTALSQRQPSAPSSAPNGLSLLNSMFESASPSTAPAKITSNASLQGEEGLRAMLGLQSRQAVSSSPLPPSHSSVTPAGLEALFASTAISPSKAPVKEKETASLPVNGKDDSAAGIVSASLQSKSDSGAALPPSLSRRDFVREVLSLIHTDKDFVDDLYQRYLSITP